MLPGDEQAARAFLETVASNVDRIEATGASIRGNVEQLREAMATARSTTDASIEGVRGILAELDRVKPTLLASGTDPAELRRVRRKLSRVLDASAALLATITPSPPAGRPAPRSDAPVVPLPAVEMGPWLAWGPVADRAWLAAVVGAYAPGPSWSIAPGTCLACGGQGIAYVPAHERWRVFVCEIDRGHAAIQLRAAL